MLRNWCLTACAVLSFAAPASAVEQLVAPTGADNLEFVFAPQKCTDAIRIHNAGAAPITITTYSCSQSVKKFVWASNNSVDKLDLIGLFQAGSAETIGRNTLALVDAYWTSGPAFLQSVWPNGGASRYVVVIPGSAVPEPSSWVLMIGGLGLISLVRRLQNRPRRKWRFGTA